MQKNVKSPNNIVFKAEFILKFKKALRKLYSYDDYMDFLVIPSIFGSKTLCYLPFLNYTDRHSDDTEDLVELAKDTKYQIRVLNFNYSDFKKRDTVTMRIDIQNKNSDEVLMEIVKRKCRTKIRKSMKNDFTFERGNSKKNIDDFYKIFLSTMYMHGTPAMGKSFFMALSDEFKDDIVFCNGYYDGEVVSSYCVLFDDEIAWAGWGGVDIRYRNKLAGYYTQWQCIKNVCDEKNIKIFDFGRSPYDGGTYEYKSQFGAIPIKIDILLSKQDDIYSKYSLASNIWKKLPKKFVDIAGAKLCKYLVDL